MDLLINKEESEIENQVFVEQIEKVIVNSNIPENEKIKSITDEYLSKNIKSIALKLV